MFSFDEFKRKFGPPLNVKPYGLTIVVQAAAFTEPDWEAELGDLGYACHEDMLDGHKVVFVPLKKTVVPGKVVYVPPKPVESAPAAAAHVARWLPEEDAFIVGLWNQGLTYSDISLKVEAKYPSRKGNSVKMRLDRLKIAGKIQPRQKHVGNSEVKNVEKTKVKGKSAQTGPDWTEDQVKLLLERWAGLGGMPKEKKAKALALFPEFEGRSSNSIYQKYYKLQLKTPKEAKKIPAFIEPADPDDNQAFTENIENISVLEEIPVENAPKIDDADVLLDLVGKVQRFEEIYDAQSRAFVELKEDFEAYAQMQSEIVELQRKELTMLTAKVAVLQKKLVGHKHFEKTGEAMLPMEAS